MTTPKVTVLLRIIEEVVVDHPYFFQSTGAGQANKASNEFVKAVQARVNDEIGEGCVEHIINTDSRMAVDYYFEDERTIVEVARLVKNPNSEFHKDILKGLLAQDHCVVDCLVFIGGRGSENACRTPARKAIIDWAYAKHGLRVEVYDICSLPRTAPFDTFEAEN